MDSVLNPEAPEFHPHLTQVVQEGYLRLNKTIKTANSFPKGDTYKLYQTYTDFNIVTNQLSKNVVLQSNQIITTEPQAVKLKCNDNGINTERIIDVNDSLLDRINLNIDTVTGVNKSSSRFDNPINVSPWNQAPVIAKIKVGSTTFIGAKNIPRPQLNFKDPVDNSDSLWVPKISDKPNNIKPLALNILYNEKGEAVGYEHPYKVELDLYNPPIELIEPEPEPPYPPPLEQTPFTYIDTETKLDELIKHLEGVSEIAVDVEHHSYRTYQGIKCRVIRQNRFSRVIVTMSHIWIHENYPHPGITCLIQITTHERGDFIIDALAIREHIHKLNLSFTDPKKVKVFHGAECDVVWLQRDFGVYIVGLFDTHQAAKVLRLHGLSLKYLLMRYCHVNTDKKYQLADWRMRPLPEELIEYARLDTHYLLYIWKQMKRELLDLGEGQYTHLLTVFEKSRQICAMTYNKEVTRDDSYMSLYHRSKKSFNTQQMAALSMLYKWRDSQARELDESTPYLLPNHMLLTLAEILPREVQGVNACCSPMPPFVKQNIITIHRIILTCRELPMEPQVFQMPAAIRTMLNVNKTTQEYVGQIHDFTYFPDYLEMNLDLAPSFDESTSCEPDVKMFSMLNQGPRVVLPELNVEAKTFFPPYDRYKTYRVVAQAEEAQAFKEKEARIAALCKGNELIKKEVLEKIQEQQNNIKTEIVPDVIVKEEPIDNVEPSEDQEGSRELHKNKKTTQRKRKIIEKTEQKDTVEITENKKKEFNNKTNNKSDVKDSIYKNINYKKFYSETGLGPRLPKMKIKKS